MTTIALTDITDVFPFDPANVTTEETTAFGAAASAVALLRIADALERIADNVTAHTTIREDQ